MLVSPFVKTVIGTGQLILPVGTRAYSLLVQSGSAYFDGVFLPAGTTLTYGSCDSKMILNRTLAVGGTGIPTNILLTYVQ